VTTADVEDVDRCASEGVERVGVEEGWAWRIAVELRTGAVDGRHVLIVGGDGRQGGEVDRAEAVVVREERGVDGALGAERRGALTADVRCAAERAGAVLGRSRASSERSDARWWAVAHCLRVSSSVWSGPRRSVRPAEATSSEPPVKAAAMEPSAQAAM
jgi:hypothetical protein